jgi:hypothetical protein
MPKMSSADLKSLLQAERSDSLGGAQSSTLTSERSKAMDYYYGDMADDMPSSEGRSSAVSTDVADTIEGLMPTLMEIFAAGEEVVRFDPVGQEDEDAAQQETDYVNHVFMQKNSGFLTLYTFIKDALLSKNGTVKVFWDDVEREERETYLDQDDGAFSIMASAPEVEIAEHTEHKDEETGAVTHDVTLVRRKKYGCARVEPVPPEEFGFARGTRVLRETTYCFHQVKDRTEADLIAQGYDEAQIKKLPSLGLDDNKENQARDTVDEDQKKADGLKGPARKIDVTEHYIRMDYEGDGKAALYRVTTGGDDLQVLRRDGKDDVVSCDVIPFATMTPIIVTHRVIGRSIADIVMDIQRIKTALVRSLLDNAYLANNQRVEVAESHAHERTLDDLLVNRPGAVVRTKQPGGINPIQNQPIGNFAFPLIEYIDATREWRTGVTRQGQGLDANALQNQSATAVNQAFTAAQARTKLIARILAETGIRDMFALLHGVIRKNDKQVNTVKLRNKWVPVDPRGWKTRDDMTINVGLGTGSRQEQVGNLTNILGIQKEIVLSGTGQMLVKPKNIYNTLEKLIERVGLKSIEPYFSDPEEIDPATGQPKQPPPPQPDPKVMQIQMQAQLDEKADQRKAQIEQVQAQADIATNQQKLQAEMAKDERDHQLKKELALFQAQLDQARFDREEARKDREHQQKMDLQREQHAAGMQQTEFGMIAGAQAHEQKMEQAKSKPTNGDGR